MEFDVERCVWNDQDDVMQFRAEMRAAFSPIRPGFIPLITGITDTDYPAFVPRTPLWTRHMLGVQEAERDRRRARR